MVDSAIADARYDRVRSAMSAKNIDALLVSPGSDLRYLTGVVAHGIERLTCLVVTLTGQMAFVVPKLEAALYDSAGLAELGIDVVTWQDGQDPYAVIKDLVGPVSRVGLADALPALHSIPLRAAISAEQVLASTALGEVRMRKQPAEIQSLQAAGAAIDRVHARMAEWLSPGRTEAEVAADIAEAVIAEGHASADFVIVGSGPNGASPHHTASDRKINPGEVVVVDIGGQMPDGYFSDSTRTYVVGEPKDPDVIDTYHVLQTAQQAAVAAVKPGVACADIDLTARKIIAEAGFGEFFIHRTGHGIGLDVHEDPYIVTGNELPLEPGMAFSVEPGIYIPQRWGARIEDIVIVTDTGGLSVNTRPHTLTQL